MSTLLDKTRMLNKILTKSGTEPVIFDDICSLLSNILSCNVYIMSRKGKILGYSFSSGFECDTITQKVIKEMRFPEYYNSRLLNVHETIANLENKGLCVLDEEMPCKVNNKI